MFTANDADMAEDQQQTGQKRSFIRQKNMQDDNNGESQNIADDQQADDSQEQQQIQIQQKQEHKHEEAIVASVHEKIDKLKNKQYETKAPRMMVYIKNKNLEDTESILFKKNKYQLVRLHRKQQEQVQEETHQQQQTVGQEEKKPFQLDNTSISQQQQQRQEQRQFCEKSAAKNVWIKKRDDDDDVKNRIVSNKLIRTKIICKNGNDYIISDLNNAPTSSVFKRENATNSKSIVNDKSGKKLNVYSSKTGESTNTSTIMKIASKSSLAKLNMLNDYTTISATEINCKKYVGNNANIKSQNIECNRIMSVAAVRHKNTMVAQQVKFRVPAKWIKATSSSSSSTSLVRNKEQLQQRCIIKVPNTFVQQSKASTSISRGSTTTYKRNAQSVKRISTDEYGEDRSLDNSSSSGNSIDTL